jgi:predicted RND superfamily exporter protein
VKRDKISKWVNAVYQFNEVSAVISYYRFPKYINKISAGYQSKSSPNQYRITFMIPLLSTTEGLILANKISEISTQFFENYQPELTGFITLYANVVEGLFSSFKQSLILSFLIIFGIMTIYIRNPKLILIALIANVLPIITMLGIMGWLKINLDMVTIPIGCLLLSIVVDDTIHIMYWYKTKKSIQEALAHAGSGIFFTSVLMVLGFIILLFSPAPPVKYFAILSLFAIVTALLCDMILLPSLLDKYLKK